jgi:hypothetical protein
VPFLLTNNCFIENCFWKDSSWGSTSISAWDPESGTYYYRNFARWVGVWWPPCRFALPFMDLHGQFREPFNKGGEGKFLFTNHFNHSETSANFRHHTRGV